ncbi:MAG: site-specific recombinase [Vicinamibacteria bacterium]|nr:site-specific recombinase [Vicinamibacteria bacterium]
MPLPAPIHRHLSTVRRLFRPPDIGALDGLLAHASPKAPYAERLEWLVSLLRWVLRPGAAPVGGLGAEEGPSVERRHPATTRLRFALRVLDRNPAWKASVAATLRAIVRDIDALEMFCETGLPREASFLTEAIERVMLRVMPADPWRTELGTALLALFPEERHADWLEALDDETLQLVAALFAHDEGADAGAAPWNPVADDVPDALLLLTSELRAAGMQSAVRRRIGAGSFRDLPFFGLTRSAEDLVAVARSGDGGVVVTALADFNQRLGACAEALVRAHAHLDEYGVSVRIVYLLERMDAHIHRARTLASMLAGESGPAFAAAFLARLVRDTLARRQLRTLVAANTRLLAKKVVDRSAETGEHYIARTREDYRAILKAAAGGGVLTVATVYGKFLAIAAHAAPLLQGLLLSANYAVSFTIMQLGHLTLATKQPAMTAPALAARMHKVETRESMDALVDEIVHLLRSQVASIFGNVALVVPGVALVALLWNAASGAPPLGAEKVASTLHAHSLFGPTPLFAAFTGVLLWLSSLAAGWFDNWLVLRGVGAGIAHSRRLAFVFGRRFQVRLAAFLKAHGSGIAGNVVLGVLLGLTPELLVFGGLPADVRHVTLSTGQVAAAMACLPAQALLESPFWMAVLGLCSAGVLNLGVSFSLALSLAIRARGVEAPQQRALWAALATRVRQRPLSFLRPE